MGMGTHFNFCFLITYALSTFFIYYYFCNDFVLNRILKTSNNNVGKFGGEVAVTFETFNLQKRNASRSFTIDYENNQFLKDGQPFHYVSGTMHHFRVPRPYWRDRLRKIRAAGLKVVSTYVEWSSNEPSPGYYKFTEEQDIEYFLQVAAEEDLLVILRPGPFICAERDFGGLPPWLMSLHPNIALRTNNSDYMTAVKKWFQVLLPKMQKYLYGNGGPIILVQVENEYGFVGHCNMDYKIWLRDLIKSYVQENAVLITTDPAGVLKCGSIPDVYATIDFQPGTNLTDVFQQMRQYSPKGPLVCSEFYDGWFSSWEETRQQKSIDSILPTMEQMLKMKVNFNIYPIEGGTSFGFKNGGDGGPYRAQTTSYDFDAALDEAGDPTPKYYAFRNLISKYFELPKIPVPKPAPKGNYGNVTLRPALSIFDYRLIPEAKTTHSDTTKTFEELNLNYGYVLYETNIPEDMPDPALLSAEGLRDRANVFIDEKQVTVFSRSRNFYAVMVETEPHARLSLLVENQGRAAGTNASPDRKGLLQEPTLNGQLLKSWTMTSLPFQNITWAYNLKSLKQHIEPPAVYVGEFVLPSSDKPLDTFMDPTGWGKGIFFVNGIHLGRYWPSEGSQVTLYVPGCYLLPAPHKNIITMFETEYTHPEYKIVFSDKPNLNKIPPKPVKEEQTSQLQVRTYKHSENFNNDENTNFGEMKKPEETELVAKKRTKRI